MTWPWIDKVSPLRFRNRWAHYCDFHSHTGSLKEKMTDGCTNMAWSTVCFHNMFHLWVCPVFLSSEMSSSWPPNATPSRLGPSYRWWCDEQIVIIFYDYRSQSVSMLVWQPTTREEEEALCGYLMMQISSLYPENMDVIIDADLELCTCDKHFKVRVYKNTTILAASSHHTHLARSPNSLCDPLPTTTTI